MGWAPWSREGGTSFPSPASLDQVLLFLKSVTCIRVFVRDGDSLTEMGGTGGSSAAGDEAAEAKDPTAAGPDAAPAGPAPAVGAAGPLRPLFSTSLHMSDVEQQFRGLVTQFVTGDRHAPLTKKAFFERLAHTPEYDLPSSQVRPPLWRLCHVGSCWAPVSRAGLGYGGGEVWVGPVGGPLIQIGFFLSQIFGQILFWVGGCLEAQVPPPPLRDLDSGDELAGAGGWKRLPRRLLVVGRAVWGRGWAVGGPLRAGRGGA